MRENREVKEPIQWWGRSFGDAVGPVMLRHPLLALGQLFWLSLTLPYVIVAQLFVWGWKLCTFPFRRRR